MRSIVVPGCTLEIDADRGVAYVHTSQGITFLRVSGLDPIEKPGNVTFIDVGIRDKVQGCTRSTREVAMP